ncbi:M48 family metallopeptidase [Myxococcota bacterium]|nr:M48 family metallopeptidase [Myxococcota bacterium]
MGRSKIVGLGIAVGLAVACATTPTGRKALHLLPSDQMAELGVQAFDQLKAQQRVSSDPQAERYVRCVADSVVDVIPRDLDAPKSWEVVVFEDQTPNAFALPGGKIGVHTGMIELADSPAQLAAVIGHEVSHVLAEHGNERVSQSLAAEGGLQLIAALAQTRDPAKAKRRQLILGLIGVGAQVGVLLPFSRTQESEADTLGLDLMARAGFDPRHAVSLWQNMERASSGAPPEFLSTHPSHGTRIENLTARMPEATSLYQQARARGRRPDCVKPVGIAKGDVLVEHRDRGE